MRVRPRLISPMITSRITAPIVALMIDGDHAAADHDAEPRQQPVGDERADDADHDVAEQAEPTPLTIRPASQPATAPTIRTMMIASKAMTSPPGGPVDAGPGSMR